jgi:hypothetical protein
VVLYVRTTTRESGQRYLAEARRYAECRDWDVVASLSDLYEAAGTASPGWQTAQDLVERRQAGGVVTRYESMIASAQMYSGVKAWLAARGAFVVSTRQGQLEAVS